jgi:hypothetical protein
MLFDQWLILQEAVRHQRSSPPFFRCLAAFRSKFSVAK